MEVGGTRVEIQLDGVERVGGHWFYPTAIVGPHVGAGEGTSNSPSCSVSLCCIVCWAWNPSKRAGPQQRKGRVGATVFCPPGLFLVGPLKMEGHRCISI